MLDRFKFRIVAKSDKKIFDVVKICFEEKKVWFYVTSLKIFSGLKCLDFDQIEAFLQCTGLTDKHGKLIWEGDVVKTCIPTRESGIGVVEYMQNGCKYVVSGFWDEISYKERPYNGFPRKKGEFFRNLQKWPHFEIIGNIYEHPELLEVGMGNLTKNLKKIKGIDNVFFDFPNNLTIFYNESSNLTKLKGKVQEYLSNSNLNRAIEKIKFYSI